MKRHILSGMVEGKVVKRGISDKANRLINAVAERKNCLKGDLIVKILKQVKEEKKSYISFSFAKKCLGL